MQLEKERGITIMAKWTSLHWKDYAFNIIDTPGHADFGSEVERVLSMVDGVCLLVDAADGPMTQTKFVLSKALEFGLKPIVVINKVDKESARITEVENEIFDLFVNLDANDEQLEYKTMYASARNGWAGVDLNDNKRGMEALFEAFVETIPMPTVHSDTGFKMLATNIEYDRHYGKIFSGKIYSGTVKVGDKIKHISREGEVLSEGKVQHLISRNGLHRVNINEAYAGDIIAIAGIPTANVTDTICHVDISEHIPTAPLDPPILSVCFSANDSPLAGKEGEHVSALKVRERILKEGENNVGLTVKLAEDGETIEVMGRGEMQIGVLMETMRREGYEFSVAPPQVMVRTDEDGRKIEPIEEVIMELDEEDAGWTMEEMIRRKGDLLEFKSIANNRAILRYLVPTRTLIGFASHFRQTTGGSGILNHVFHEYGDYRGTMEKTRKGVLICMSSGVSTSYALNSLEARGTLFIGPQVSCYEGMIVGESARDGDLEVNPCREKHLTNMRASGKEEQIRLHPPKKIQLEEALAYIQPDELIEVTPHSVRLRKKLLSSLDRRKASRNKGSQ